MSDKYQPLRDAVATSSMPVGPTTFPRILELLGDLLKERDALRADIERLVEIADRDPFQTIGFIVEHVVDLRATLADGEASNGS